MLATLAMLGLGCKGSLPSREDLLPRTPHERYARALKDAGLDQTALGRDWLAAGERALRAAPAFALPLSEAVYFPADAAGAASYRLSLRRGERLMVSAQVEGVEPARLFLDLFVLAGDSVVTPIHRAAAEDEALALDHEVERDGAYVLRVQPELLRATRARVTARLTPTLAFPVAGRGGGAVRSLFGADRDAGRRTHQGIDIFAPRGTPAVAATDGWIRNVGVSRLGGNVVWLWDPTRGQSLYYAHLDTQLVRPGARVRAGDTLGLVGNTGNARTTPPHLHFGIYRRGEGAIDPFRWVYAPREQPPRVEGELATLGTSRRLRRESMLRGAPGAAAPGLAPLPSRTLVRLGGLTGGWARVALPDGRSGFLPVAALERADAPLATARLTSDDLLRERPDARAAPLDSVPAGSRVGVLGEFAGYRLVRTASGQVGWVGGG
ncbi:MAG TPA: M23 family metallopeptidase [Gemmatimonadaceae bacterium]|nr:M23 family metallopeptidase [Gemmatimonadaceae bacterium]